MNDVYLNYTRLSLMVNHVKYVMGSKYAFLVRYGVGTLDVRPPPPAFAFLNCDGGSGV